MPLTLEQFKNMTKAERDAHGDTLPFGEVNDANGRQLTHKNSAGGWCESTYDNNGNKLTYKNSVGSWYERTYENEEQRTYKDSDGIRIGFTNEQLKAECKELKAKYKQLKKMRKAIKEQIKE